MKRESISIFVEPGICGFSCLVAARRQDRHLALIEITGSECELVRKMAESLKEVTQNDIFMQHTRNQVFRAAEQAGCHLTCAVPVAVLKAAEAALELALPKDVHLRFGRNEDEDAS